MQGLTLHCDTGGVHIACWRDARDVDADPAAVLPCLRGEDRQEPQNTRGHLASHHSCLSCRVPSDGDGGAVRS